MYLNKLAICMLVQSVFNKPTLDFSNDPGLFLFGISVKENCTNA